jgi:hypothetical protein
MVPIPSGFPCRAISGIMGHGRPYPPPISRAPRLLAGLLRGTLVERVGPHDTTIWFVL